MSAANQLPYLMTVAEFLAWDTPDGSHRWELIDGTPEAMAPASDRHAAILAETGRLIGNHLANAREDCRVLVQPGIAIGDYNLRIPDLSVSCRSDTEGEERAALVVEILSPSNARDTWRAVVGYTTRPGVLEILVLHSTEIKAELVSRAPDGTWPRVTLLAGGTIKLMSIGLTVPIEALYRTSGLVP